MFLKFKFFLIVCFFTGCAVQSSFISPEVSITNFRITEVSFLETLSEITVRIDNENPQPLKVKGGVYSIYLNGARAGKAMSSSEFEIPPFDSVYQTLVMKSPNISVGLKIKDIIEAEEFDYEISGFIYIDEKSALNRLSFNYSGDFSFKKYKE